MKPLQDYVLTEEQDINFKTHRVVVAIGPDVIKLQVGDKIHTDIEDKLVRESDVKAIYD